MRKGWEYKRLDECANIEYGTRVVQKKDSGTLYPVYGGGGETFRMDKFNREDCLIVARFAMSRRCVRYVNGKFFLNDSGLSVKAGDKLYQSYLNYNIISLNDDIYHLGKGAAQRNLDVKSFKKLTIAIPPQSTQLAIVTELDKINELIRLKKEQLKDFDNLAQSLFYEMFGDPVENEKGWEVKKIKDIAKYYNGVAHEQDVDKDGDFVLINAKFISSEGQIKKYTSIQRFPLLKNDIVMVLSDLPNGKSLAKCFLIDEDNKYTLNQRICCFRGFEGSSVYLKNIINRNPYLLSFDNGKGQTNLRKGDVEKIPIPLPPLPLQRLFAQRIEQIEREKSEVQNPSRISKPCWLPACNTGSNRS